MSKQKLKLWLLISSTATLVFIFLFALIPNAVVLDNTAIKDTVRFEIIKNLLELLVVVIVGGFIAFLFKEAEETKKNDQDRRDIRLDYFKRLGEIYRKVKSIRRALRAGGLTTKYIENGHGILSENQVDLYKAQMKDLNDYQLNLEELKIEATNLPAYFGLSNLPGSLEKMEKYIGKILDEFEEKCPLVINKSLFDFKDFERLDEFTGTAHRNFTFSTDKIEEDKTLKSPFKEFFSGSHDDAIKEISKTFFKKNNGNNK